MKTAGLIGLLLLILVGGWVAWKRPFRETCWDCVLPWGARHSHERPAPGSLKTLASAQADFRANDRDGDGVQQFWRTDVSSLYTLRPKGDLHPIKLIELSVAASDAQPAGDILTYALRQPKRGYWIRAIRHADEDPAKLDPNRFAFCAYPDDLSEHRSMFIISEGNTVFKAPAVKGGADVFPDDAALRRNWFKID